MCGALGYIVRLHAAFALKKIGLDPTTSSAPFIATIVDVTGLIIYFTIAYNLLIH